MGRDYKDTYSRFFENTEEILQCGIRKVFINNLSLNFIYYDLYLWFLLVYFRMISSISSHF